MGQRDRPFVIQPRYVHFLRWGGHCVEKPSSSLPPHPFVALT